MTSVSAGKILTDQPVGSGRPQRGSNPGPPYQEARALPTELPGPLDANGFTLLMISHLMLNSMFFFLHDFF